MPQQQIFNLRHKLIQSPDTTLLIRDTRSVYVKLPNYEKRTRTKGLLIRRRLQTA